MAGRIAFTYLDLPPSTQNCILKMLLDRINAMRIGNLGVRGAIHDIQSIDGGAVLCVNTRKRD
jgi:hypothetical protein